MGLRTSLRTLLDGFGFKGRLVFHALFWRSSTRPALLMWSRSNLMTITMAYFWFCSAFQGAAFNSLSCTENVSHHVFITTVIFSANHKVASLWRTTGRTSWLLHKSSLCPSSFFFRLSLFSVSLPLSHSVYIQTSMSRVELASELSLRTAPFRFQISQDIQCTSEFINTEFEPCLPSSIRVTSRGRTMPNTSPFFFTAVCPLQACPDCHPASFMRSMTSASPLPPRYPNNIQHSSGLAAFLDSSSP